ncbi:MAG: DUF4242 domain-containing protein [Actinomycetota bacterium]|nr:DUF4242 domain-containing protein [Actinomycetota bacterium]
MTTARRSTFLVERYLPSPAQASLAASVARVVQACAKSGCDGREVRYLHSTYLPAEELCFCVFQGPSSAAVQAVNDAAHFALDRITDAVPMYPPSRRLT